MKLLKLCLVALVISLGLTSCQSVQVVTDYDRTVNFSDYHTFAFYKPTIDKAKISDLDKRRILRAIDSSLTAKGLTKSDTPDLLVSIVTKSAKNINVHQNYYGWGAYWGGPWYWGMSPYWGNNYYTSTNTDGTLYINLIDADKNMLVWQGVGTGLISPEGNVSEKVERINTIVREILNRYPPGSTTQH